MCPLVTRVLTQLSAFLSSLTLAVLHYAMKKTTIYFLWDHLTLAFMNTHKREDFEYVPYEW